MTAPELRVAVTGWAGTSNPDPGTGVARALRAGWPGRLVIEAIGYDPWMTGAWSPGLADRLHLIPTIVGADDDPILARVLAIHDAHPIDALIPCLDLEVQVFARLAPRLAQAGIRTLLPAVGSVLAAAKPSLPTLCHARRIVTPRTIHVVNLDHVPFYADQFGYPLMIKGTVAGAKRVENLEQARLEGRRLAEKWGGGVLLQELVTGHEYDVAMVAGRDGTALAQVAMRKLALTSKGKCAMGAVVDDPGLLQEAKRILGQLEWAGPLELEFVRVPATGQLYLLEVNCRFPSWIMLSHWAGANLPVALLREMLGERSEAPMRPTPGTAFVRDVAEMAVPAKRVEDLRRHRQAPGMPAAAARSNIRQGVRVAVTGVNSLNTVMAGLGVARALRRAPQIGAIYGLCYGPYDTGLYRGDLFDAVYRLPDSEDPEILLQRLRALRDQVEIDVLLPCLDVELSRFLAIADELARLGVRMLLPPAESVARTQKLRLFLDHNRFDWGGFRLPETHKIWTLQGVHRAAQALGFPMVVKGPVSGARVVRDLDEATAAWLALRSQDHEETLAQAHIEGDEFALAAVCGKDHEIIDSVTIKKYLQDGGGSTWSAGPVDEPALVESFQAFLRELEWRGPIEGEFLRSAFDERFYLFEVNPRSTAWVGYSADCNANLPLQTVLAALDRPRTPGHADGKSIFMRTCEEVPVSPGALAAFTMKGRLIHA